MTRQFSLSEDDRRRFAELMTALGLTGKQLAGLAKISQPWLSQVLKGRRTSVDGEMLERVANVLLDRLKNRTPDTKLPEDRIRVALAFLSRFSSAVAAPSSPKIYRPGGPVPVDAAHYIERGADNYTLEALQMMPFTMLVRGPVQCGKSSLLKRLEHKAQEVAIETARFDPQQIYQQPDIEAAAVQELYELLRSKWELGPFSARGNIPNNIYDLINWMERVMTPSNKPRLLILDDLSSLGTDVVDRWLSNFVRGLDGLRDTLQVSVAVGLTYQFDASFHRRLIDISTIVHWKPLVDVDWFGPENVNKLIHTDTAASFETGDLFELFAGQPYLTHVAVVDKDFREAVREWKKNKTEKNASSVRGQRAYRMHLRAIQSAINGPTLIPSQSAKDLLRDFTDCLSNESALSQSLLNPAHRKFFEVAKLLKHSGEPTLGIYSLVAEQLSDGTVI